MRQQVGSLSGTDFPVGQASAGPGRLNLTPTYFRFTPVAFLSSLNATNRECRR